MPRAGLDRAAVIAAALGIVDDAGTRGFSDLTLSAIAARVGVAGPSLYKHVSSLADVRRGVAVASVDELTTRIAVATMGRAGRKALEEMASAVRTYAHEHPGRYAATQVAADPENPDDAELARNGAQAIAALAAVLRGFDLPPELETEAIRIVRSALHGFIVLELGGGFGLPDDLDLSFRLLIDTIDAGIQRLARQRAD